MRCGDGNTRRPADFHPSQTGDREDDPMKKATILIVEDEAIIAADLANHLERLGYEVAGIVASAEQALAAARSGPDLVLMDIQLRGALDGVTAADLIRGQHDVPVIFLTAHSDAGTLQRAKLTESFGYILKPYDERLLGIQIEMALSRHRADQRVRESEERHRTLTLLAPDLLFVVDRQGRLLEVNLRACECLGYSREELLQLRVIDLVLDYSEQSVSDVIEQVEPGKTMAFEGKMRRRDGAALPVDVRLGGLVLQGQSLIMASVRDITERKEAERARERRLDQVKTLLELSTGLLKGISLPLLMQHIVDAAERLTGARFGVCGHGYRDGSFDLQAASRSPTGIPCPPGTRFTIERGGVYKELLEEHSTIRYTQSELLKHPAWWGLPEGHAPLCGLLGARLAGEDGKAIGLIMVSNKASGDFTIEDEAWLAQLAAVASLGMQNLLSKQEALRQAKQLAAVFESQTEAVLVYDREGVPRQVNPATVEICGFNPVGMSRAELIRRLDMRLINRHRPGPNDMPCAAALKGERRRGDRIMIRTAVSGQRILLACSSPVVIEGEISGAVCVWHDVTEREQLLATLERRVMERTLHLSSAVRQLESAIADGQRSREALIESEAQYRTLFNEAPVGLLITSAGGEILEANQSACSILGYDLHELRTVKAPDLYVTKADRIRLLRRIRRHGRASEQSMPLRRKDGSRFIAMIQINRVQVQGRRLLLTMLQDLTRAREAERINQGVARLLEYFAKKTRLERYLKDVIQLICDWTDCRCGGIRLVDNHGFLPYAASVGFSRSFLSREQEMNLQGSDCACLQVLQAASDPGKPRRPRGETSFFSNKMSVSLAQQFDGKAKSDLIPCLQQGYESIAHVPVRWHGRLMGSIHLADRRPHRFDRQAMQFIEAAAPLLGEALHHFQVEDELRESEERFRSMFETHDAVMLLIDPQSSAIEDANHAAASFYGYSRSRLRQMQAAELGMMPEVSTGDKPALGLGNDRGSTFNHRLASGETRAVEIHSSRIVVGRKELLFSIIHDVTERQRLEAQVLNASELERQRIGRDLHDSLGGTLTGIAMMSKSVARTLGRKQLPESAVVEEMMRAVNQAVSESRVIAHDLCPFDPGTEGLTNGLRDLVASVSRFSNVDCRLDLGRGLPPIAGWMTSQLYRIAQEAVNNAIRHGKAKHILLRLRQLPGTLSLQIRDDGAGFSPGRRTTHGMGLRTMKHRVNVLGGRIEVESTPRRGTLVTCRIPISSGNG
jgi:PAS domain S-box-containing protein